MMTYGNLYKEQIENYNSNRPAAKQSCTDLGSKLTKTKVFKKIMTMVMLSGTAATPALISEFLNQDFDGASKARHTFTDKSPSHMTLKGAFENSSKAATSAQQPKIVIEPIKRINKPNLQLQHSKQHQHPAQNGFCNSSACLAIGEAQEHHQLTVSPSDLANTLENPTSVTIHPTTVAATGTLSAEVVENSLNETQCNVVGNTSKGSPKQKCTHQQKQNQQQQQEQQKVKQNEQHKHPIQQQQHQSHCKSANIRRCSSNICTVPPRIDNATTTNISANSTTNTITITDNNAIIINSTTKPLAAAASPSPASSPSTSSPPSSSPTTATYCNAYRLRRFCNATIKIESMLRAVMFSFVFIMSLQFQCVAASTSMMTKHEPMFISRSETFKFVAGDTIVLPCEVANTDPYVVAWKRGIAILTAGSVKVTPDPRVRLVNGFNLQIRDAVPQDAGDYICQIATMEPREITHTVEILVPPRIHHISTSGHLQVKKGSSVRIECSASGNPTPNVTWSRKNNILPNGEEKLHSHILSIENVDRHKGGVYICTANNGVGQPASSQVVLHVLYPPEITVERPVVFSGEGHEAMLVCIVHGETQPEVIWFKDTMQLDTTERHIMENRGSRHTLIIRKVHPQDFGNYSCVAENQLGKSRKTLQLSGKPNVAVFNSPPISQYKDRYNISWTVESHTPIEEYKLSFRRLQQGQEVDNSIDSHSSSSSSLSSSSSSSSMLQMYGGSMGGSNAHNYRLGSGGISMSSLGNMNGNMGGGGYGSYGAGNVIHWGRNDWRDVVLPAIPISHHYTQGMSYMIRGLDPDQHYEATVQARNRYGWSDYSQSFVFSTSSNDNEMRDLSVTFYGSRSSRIAAKNCYIPPILAVISMRYLAI